MKIKNYLQITGTMLLFLCCAGSKGDGQISIQERFDLGLENLENEKYLKGIDELGFDTIYRERIGETHSILFHENRYEGFADLRRPNAGVAIQID